MSKAPRPVTRSHLSDSETRLAQKKHLEEAGLMSGLVEIPGPLPGGLEEEIRNIAARMEEEEAARRPGSAVLAITPFAGGLAIETRGEKLAQRIADALGRSRKAVVERALDDEGRRRILTCRLPKGD